MGALAVVILAAGQGTRMNSRLPKVLHPIAGRPMVQYVLDMAAALTEQRPVVVVGYGAELVRQTLGDVATFVALPESPSTVLAATAYGLFVSRPAMLLLKGNPLPNSCQMAPASLLAKRP